MLQGAGAKHLGILRRMLEYARNNIQNAVGRMLTGTNNSLEKAIAPALEMRLKSKLRFNPLD